MAVSNKFIPLSGIAGITLAGSLWLGAQHLENIRKNTHILTDTIGVLLEDGGQFYNRHQLFMEHADEEIAHRQSKVYDLNNQVHQLENDVQAADEELAALSLEREYLENQIVQQESLIETFTTKRDELLQEGITSAETLAALNEEIAGLTAEAVRMREEKNTLVYDIAAYQQRFNEAIFEAGYLSLQIFLLNEEIEELTAQLEELQDQNSLLTSELNQANEEIYRLGAEVQRVTEQALDEFDSRAVPTDLQLDLPSAS